MLVDSPSKTGFSRTYESKNCMFCINALKSELVDRLLAPRLLPAALRSSLAVIPEHHNGNLTSHFLAAHFSA